MKKIFYTIGSIAATTIPAISLVSCGPDKPKTEEIISDPGAENIKHFDNSFVIDLSILDKEHFLKWIETEKLIGKAKKGFIKIRFTLLKKTKIYKIDVKNWNSDKGEQQQLFYAHMEEIMFNILNIPYTKMERHKERKLTKEQNEKYKKAMDNLDKYKEKIKDELNTKKKYQDLHWSKTHMDYKLTIWLNDKFRTWIDEMDKYVKHVKPPSDE